MRSFSKLLFFLQKGIEDLHALQLPGRDQFTPNRVRDSSQQHSHRPLLVLGHFANSVGDATFRRNLWSGVDVTH